MATIKHKQNSEKGVPPSTSDLVLGELAINTNDGAIYLKTEDSSGTTAIDALRSFKVFNSSGTRIY